MMLRLLKRAAAHLTGGRPMRLEGPALYDAIAREPVDYYVDAFGRRWMATSPWASFRVLAANQSPEGK